MWYQPRDLCAGGQPARLRPRRRPALCAGTRGAPVSTPSTRPAHQPGTQRRSGNGCTRTDENTRTQAIFAIACASAYPASAGARFNQKRPEQGASSRTAGGLGGRTVLNSAATLRLGFDVGRNAAARAPGVAAPQAGVPHPRRIARKTAQERDRATPWQGRSHGSHGFGRPSRFTGFPPRGGGRALRCAGRSNPLPAPRGGRR